MFREMRLKEQALSQDEIEKVLTTAANGTSKNTGLPHS